MAFQPIGLGTPNNNDGDSLYAGGKKINDNFAELYTNLAGGSSLSLKISVGSAFSSNTSTVLGWSSAEQKFVPVLNDYMEAYGTTSINTLFVTDGAGNAGGADDALTGPADSLVGRLNGRGMFLLRASRNTSTATTRGSFEINLGNANVTSLGVYTTGVVVRGASGLSVIATAGEDDTSLLYPLLDSQTSGMILYRTPRLDISSMSASVRTGSDSSMAVAHTGYVQVNLARYPTSSTQVRGARGVVSDNPSQNLTGNSTFYIDGVYHPKHVEGLIYNYNTLDNKITLVTGAACHWSYNTSGVAGIVPTTAIAVVASYNPIIRTFTTGWTPQYTTAGTTPAVIDGSITANTWYYLYYIGCLIYTSSAGTGVGNEFWPGSSNVVVSSNRDIASVDAQLAAAGYGGIWQVVRRLGPVKSNASGTGIIPFNVKRIDHGGFEYYWGLQPNASGDTSYTLTINTASSLKVVGSSATFTLQDYNSAVLTAVPPIPGITAHLTIKHLTPATSPLPLVYMYGDSWTVNSSISALFPPFEYFRNQSTGITCVHRIQLPMSPDGCYIPDGVYGGAGILAITTSTGLRVRWIMQNPENEGNKPLITSTLLQITTTGFRYAR